MHGTGTSAHGGLFHPARAWGIVEPVGRPCRYAEHEIQPLHAAFFAAAEAMGVARTDDLDDLDGGEGCASNPVNVVDGVRCNTAFAYLDPARGDPHLEIHGHALVDRLVLDGSRVRGVIAIVDGRARRIDADLVVLSAGVYGSPEILLRSGIGDPRELARVWRPVRT